MNANELIEWFDGRILYLWDAEDGQYYDSAIADELVPMLRQQQAEIKDADKYALELERLYEDAKAEIKTLKGNIEIHKEANKNTMESLMQARLRIEQLIQLKNYLYRTHDKDKAQLVAAEQLCLNSFERGYQMGYVDKMMNRSNVKNNELFTEHEQGKEMNANELADEFNNVWSPSQIEEWAEKAQLMLRQQQAEIEFLKKEILAKHEDWKHEGQQAANAKAEKEALKVRSWEGDSLISKLSEEIEALKKQLALWRLSKSSEEIEQVPTNPTLMWGLDEPVGHFYPEGEGATIYDIKFAWKVTGTTEPIPLYTHSANLTDEEIADFEWAIKNVLNFSQSEKVVGLDNIIRAILRKAQEK